MRAIVNAEQRLEELGIQLPSAPEPFGTYVEAFQTGNLLFGVFVAKVADGASVLLESVFGKENNPTRLVYGVSGLPLGTPVELEVIFELAAS